MASTVANLSAGGCYYTTNQPKYVVGVNCMVVLPTSLLFFRGQVQNGLGNLQWTTTGEVPGLQFVLERSDDGTHYSPITTLQGVAPAGEGAAYQFTDPTPVAVQSYYRITMVSNSISRFSNLVLLSNSNIQFNVRSVLNPFIDQINIEMTVPTDGQAVFSLIDMYGRYLRRMIQPVNQGLNNLTMYGLGNLPNGTYALQIQYNDKLISEKVLKVSQ